MLRVSPSCLLLLLLAPGCKCKSEEPAAAPEYSFSPFVEALIAARKDAGSLHHDAGADAGAAADAGEPAVPTDAGAPMGEQELAERAVAEAARALAARGRRVGGLAVGRTLSLCGEEAPIERYAAPGVPRGAQIPECVRFADELGGSVPPLTVQALEGAWVQLNDGDWVLRDALTSAEVLLVGDVEYLLQGHDVTFELKGATAVVWAQATACELERCGNSDPPEGEPDAPPRAFSPPPPGLQEELLLEPRDAGAVAPVIEKKFLPQCCT